MTIKIEDPGEYELKDMLWSGAEDTLQEIIDEGYYDEFISFINDVYSDGIGLTELNDLLRFDGEQVKKDIGMKDWNELKELLNSKAIAKAKSVIVELEEQWPEFSTSDENKDKNGKIIYNTIEDWVNDTYSSEDYNIVKAAINGIEDEVLTTVDDKEKSDELDVMIEAIKDCGLETTFGEFEDIVDMVTELEDWLDY